MIKDVKDDLETALALPEHYQRMVTANTVLLNIGLTNHIERIQSIYNTYPSLKFLTGEEYQMGMKQKDRAVYMEYCKEEGILPYALVR